MKLGLNYQRPNLSLSVANRKGNAGAAPPVETFFISLEDGDDILLEDGDNLLLESNP